MFPSVPTLQLVLHPETLARCQLGDTLEPGSLIHSSRFDRSEFVCVLSLLGHDPEALVRPVDNGHAAAPAPTRPCASSMRRG